MTPSAEPTEKREGGEMEHVTTDVPEGQGEKQREVPRPRTSRINRISAPLEGTVNRRGRYQRLADPEEKDRDRTVEKDEDDEFTQTAPLTKFIQMLVNLVTPTYSVFFYYISVDRTLQLLVMVCLGFATITVNLFAMFFAFRMCRRLKEIPAIFARFNEAYYTGQIIRFFLCVPGLVLQAIILSGYEPGASSRTDLFGYEISETETIWALFFGKLIFFAIGALMAMLNIRKSQKLISGFFFWLTYFGAVTALCIQIGVVGYTYILLGSSNLIAPPCNAGAMAITPLVVSVPFRNVSEHSFYEASRSSTGTSIQHRRSFCSIYDIPFTEEQLQDFGGHWTCQTLSFGEYYQTFSCHGELRPSLRCTSVDDGTIDFLSNTRLSTCSIETQNTLAISDRPSGRMVGLQSSGGSCSFVDYELASSEYSCPAMSVFWEDSGYLGDPMLITYLFYGCVAIVGLKSIQFAAAESRVNRGLSVTKLFPILPFLSAVFYGYFVFFWAPSILNRSGPYGFESIWRCGFENFTKLANCWNDRLLIYLMLAAVMFDAVSVICGILYLVWVGLTFLLEACCFCCCRDMSLDDLPHMTTHSQQRFHK